MPKEYRLNQTVTDTPKNNKKNEIKKGYLVLWLIYITDRKNNLGVYPLPLSNNHTMLGMLFCAASNWISHLHQLLTGAQRQLSGPLIGLEKKTYCQKII